MVRQERVFVDTSKARCVIGTDSVDFLHYDIAVALYVPLADTEP
jgi:hypothetical protein